MNTEHVLLCLGVILIFFIFLVRVAQHRWLSNLTEAEEKTFNRRLVVIAIVVGVGLTLAGLTGIAIIIARCNCQGA